LHHGRRTLVWEVKVLEEKTRRLLAAALMTFAVLESLSSKTCRD
jgi:acyl-coenzyme A thioesterase PaaI-like protein